MHVSPPDDLATPGVRKQKERTMFHVLDHTDLVYSGDLSQATQYVLERSGKRLDEAIRSGIRILYSDAQHRMKLGRCLVPPPVQRCCGHSAARTG